MKSEITKYWEDLNGIYPYAEAVLYVYCDKCGSFSIKLDFGRKLWFMIVVVCGIMTVGILSIFQPGYLNSIGFFSSLVVCIIIFAFLRANANFRYRKCGSVPSTKHNTLDYPSDMKIIDVPHKLTQTRTLGYWPETDDIDSMLKRREEENR